MLTLLDALERAEKLHKNYVEQENKNHEKTKEDIENSYLFFQEAIANNMRSFTGHSISYYGIINPVVTVRCKEDWRIIHAIVGPLQSVGKEPIGDGRSRKVKVRLLPKNEKFHHIEFNYVTKLPKNAKCRIVTITSKSSRIVCSK